MLVLSRRLKEAIVIDGGIRITIEGIKGNQVRLGIEAPAETRIYRQELLQHSHAVADMPAGSVEECVSTWAGSGGSEHPRTSQP